MIYIYAMDIMKLDQELSAYAGEVPEARLYQLGQLTGQQRMLSLAAELLFQRSVRRHCREVPTPVSRDRDENGKPYLLGRPDFHFNLSHSGMWAVCAVADTEVGVDLQQDRPVPGKVARRFTHEEQAMLSRTDGGEKAALFFDLWVQKEAYLKCTGEGIRRDTRTFQAANPSQGYVNQLVEFPVPGYHLAVCTQSETADEVLLVIMPL